ncbi:DEAD/DEAH box helicase, partial [Chloroflexota bacterium]
MDIDAEGCHVVRVFYKTRDDLKPVKSVSSLWDYGFFKIDEREDKQALFSLKAEDRYTLLALKSMNPDIQSDGSLKFEVEPPILKYLRRKENLKEHDASKEVTIFEEPLKPTAKIDFQKEKGLTIETGYTLADGKEFARQEKLQITKDGKYAKFGKNFVPLPDLKDNIKNMLNKGIINVSVAEIPEFFQRDLVMIKKEFNAVLTDLAQNIHIVSDPLKPIVHVQKGERGWLDFNVTYNAAGFDLPHGLLAERKDQNYIQIDPMTWVSVDHNIINKTDLQLQAIGAEAIEESYRLPVYEFATLDEFIRDIGGRAELSKAYQEFLNQLTGFEANHNYQLPGKFEEYLQKQGLDLRPYQRGGIHWLDWLRSNYLHGVLADDMGLGKTMQSLCALRLAYEHSKSKQHSLVISPKSVLLHWASEIDRIFPSQRVYIYHESKRNNKIFNSNMPYIIITTYTTLTYDIDDFSKYPFFYLILDEATRIKNPDTQRTKAVKALNATYRLALSGTPIENRPTELWSLFDFLMRGHLGKYGTFCRVYEESILAGDGHASQMLGRRVKPFFLRRKKEQVAKDLPEKIVISERCELTHEQKQLYGGLQDQVKGIRDALQCGEQVSYTGSILPVLTKLKQICDHPALVNNNLEPLYGRSEKFDWIMERVYEILEAGEQLVIFSQYLKMLSLIEAELQVKLVSYIRIDGSTANRQGLIDYFNAGKAKVALLSIMAAGHGINLTAANHVIHADRWWNPAVEDQATDRVHRIGQFRTVFIY